MKMFANGITWRKGEWKKFIVSMMTLRGVVIASSMPSIEFWFLLHYENTNRFFGTSPKVIETLRKYLVNFDKKDQFLRQDKWVVAMIENGKMSVAYERAKRLSRSGESYSDFWKAIDIIE